GGEHAEEQELADEPVPVAVLDGVEEAAVPSVEHDVDGHDPQFAGDHGPEQGAAGPAVVGKKIGCRKPPDGAERRDKAFHGRSPVIGCERKRAIWGSRRQLAYAYRARWLAFLATGGRATMTNGQLHAGHALGKG